MEVTQNTNIIPTEDHEAAPGFSIITLVGGPAGGQTVWLHIEQSTHEAEGETYRRIDAHRFAADALLRGAWGQG